MKKFISIMIVFLSFNIFAKRYEGGYVNGKWHALYNNNYLQRFCIDGFATHNNGACSSKIAFWFWEIELSVIGIAEIKNEENGEPEILLKVSDFKIEIPDDENYDKNQVYTAYTYPVPPENKGKPYFPKFSSIPKDEFLNFLKENNKNLKFNNKEWIEEYEYLKDTGEYERKKVKFLGVEKINLNLFGNFDWKGDEIWIRGIGPG